MAKGVFSRWPENLPPLAGIDQLRRDRDELVAALEKAVAFHWEDPDYDGEAANEECRAVLARVKAGK